MGDTGGGGCPKSSTKSGGRRRCRVGLLAHLHHFFSFAVGGLFVGCVIIMDMACDSFCFYFFFFFA